MIRGLTKRFGAHGRRGNEVVALGGVDLDVAEGEFAAVLGPSGCGKTTLLRSIAGFEAPDAGVIRLGGRTVFEAGSRAVPAYARGVGMVPQDGALFPHLDVAHNVGFGLSGLRSGDRAARVDEVLELVGLGGYGRRRPHELSGGQQQRVALARALAPGSGIILLDEPFSALDAHLRQSLREEVRDLLVGLRTTSLLVTHDQAEALSMADHLIVMIEGRVVSSGEPRESYRRPGDLVQGRFLGDAIVLPGHVDVQDSPVAVTALGRVPVDSWEGVAGRCEVLIRPEDITVRRSSAEERGSGGGVGGTVVGRAYFGHHELVRVAIDTVGESVQVRVMGERELEGLDGGAVIIESSVGVRVVSGAVGCQAARWAWWARWS